MSVILADQDKSQNSFRNCPHSLLGSDKIKLTGENLLVNLTLLR